MELQPLLRVGIGLNTDQPLLLANLLAHLSPDLPATLLIAIPGSVEQALSELQTYASLPLHRWTPETPLQAGHGFVLSWANWEGAAPPFAADEPALDRWFQELAQHGGDRTIGLLLSDSNRPSGRTGLAAIQRAGGTGLVVPCQALQPEADTPLSAASLAQTLTTLVHCAQVVPPLPEPEPRSPVEPARLADEAVSDPTPCADEIETARDALFQQVPAILDYLQRDAPIGLGVVDANLRYVFANEWLRWIHGNDADTPYFGQSIEAIVPELSNQIKPYYQQVLATGDPLLNLEFQRRLPQQPEIEYTLLLSYYPIEPTPGVRMVGVTVVDVTELRRAEDTLASYNRQLASQIVTTEKRFRQMATNFPGALWRYVLHPDGRDQVYYLNSGCYDLWEVEAEVAEDDANVLWERVHPDDRPHLRESVLLSAQTLTPWEFEWRIQTASGREKWVQGRGRPERGEQGEVVWDSLILDVSDRKQTELALHEQEQFLRCIYENVQFGIFVLHIDEDGSFWEAGHNPAHAKALGVAENAWKGRRIEDVLSPEQLAELIPNYRRCIEQGRPITYEEHIQLSGNLRWWLTTLTPVPDQTGRIYRIVGTAIDITHLKEIQHKLQLLTDNTPGVIYRYALYPDGTNQMLHISSGCQELWELSAAEILEDVNQIWAMVHPRDLEAMRLAVMQSAENLEPWRWQWRITTPSGKERWLEAASRPTRLEDGTVVWDGLILDVSDRKKREERLRLSAAKLKATQRVAQIGTWELDLQDWQLQWSPEIFQMFGRDPDSTPPSWEELLTWIHPQDRASFQQTVRQAIATAQPSTFEDLRIFHRDGSIRYLEIRGEAILDDQNTPQRMFGTALDITARKHAEAALAEREAFFRSLFDQAGVGIALMDLEGHYTRVNDRYCEILGYSADELLDQDFMRFTDPADLKRTLASMQPLLRGETQYFSTEQRYLRKDGRRVWVHLTGSLVRDQWGYPCNMLGIVHDVSDRKRTETALNLSEQRFRTIFENAAIGIAIEFPPDYCLSFSNPTFQTLLGYTDKELARLNYKDITVADDLMGQAILVDECQTGQRDSYRLEKRYIRKDGRIIWVNMHTSVLRDEEGEIQLFISMVEDITERKRAMAMELDQNRALREAIFEESTDALFLVEPENLLILDCNPRAVELFGATTKADLIRRTCHQFYRHPLSLEDLEALRSQVRETGVWNGEVEYLSLQDQAFWGRLVMKMIQLGDRALYLVQVTDISTRKQIELDMLRNMEELQRLSQSKDDFLSTVSHELRTPLTSIDMASRMLRITLEQNQLLDLTNPPAGSIPNASKATKPSDPEKISHYLRILQEQCQQERELINDLLDLQRLNADAYELELTEIDLPSWLEPITRDIRDRATEHEQQFQVSCAADLPILRTDAAVLRRILSELLNNACKYTPPQERIHLTVRSTPPAPERQELSQVQFCIENTGIEISEADQLLIFEPFHRAVKGDRWSKRGTGLGLTLVKKFTHRLQGSIRVESQSNITRFCLDLPIRVACPIDPSS